MLRNSKNRSLPATTSTDALDVSLSPLLSVDTVIFSVIRAELSVLLVKRAIIPGKARGYPFQGKWALVGGVLNPKLDRTLEAAALRRLREKTNVKSPYLEQLQTFGEATRDPRKWSASVVYFALISAEGLRLKSGNSVEQVQWWPIKDALGLKLGFDHNIILEVALSRLRAKVEYTTLPVNLLPPEFTLSELQEIYEIILGRSLDKSSFRKRTLSADFIEEAPKMRVGRNRPAQLYRIKSGGHAVLFPRTFYS